MSKLIQVRSTTEATSVVDTLKLALEALERCVEKFYAMRTQKILGCIPNDAVFASGAILAIREALAEQPAKQQEPVAVMTVLHLKDRTEIGYGPASAGYDLPTGEYKLYTSSPASKPWVGLTDEEISNLWCEVTNTDFVTADTHEFARAIEAKLREKNA